MTSAEIRQSFLDFFKSKQHTIVPSSSLMPDSPNLLFTNAGMNQFVPIFLGQTKCPYKPGRAADTQKCIRAGGKHNDLEDVGLDTYHHTFFEMLGNWSFGDYFKKEAIEWAWELVVEKWKFPAKRLYATVYKPGPGEPSEFDQEAYDIWAKLFRAAGLDPKVHVCSGGQKDNFWMMGDTGPCGPCSEIHMDLTPAGDTKGSLVNKGDARCIEIWNLVFIQFNANADGTFSPLPAKHVDTGMGFERVTGIIQCTKNFKDFSRVISNYETDIFRPIFDALEKMSGKKYGSTLPQFLRSATVPVASVGVPPTESDERGARASAPATVGVSPTEFSARGASYHKRRLPHFERPWAKYMISFSTHERRQLSPRARDIVLKSLLFGHEQRRYELYAACVMPDHVHFLFEPQIKEQDKEGKPVFWLLTEILQAIKSFTAHEINKAEGAKGQVWENESFDRMIRGDADLEEKFHYICRNPWDSRVVPITENYLWLWTPDVASEGGATALGASSRISRDERRKRDADDSGRDARAPRAQEQIQIDIAFRVIADHIRTLSFAIADGIQPGNNDRNYVLRRILRRAVRYGRTLGFHEPFFYKLVDVLADTMGDVFPEIRAKKKHVREVIRVEEEAFNKTLDTGIVRFHQLLVEDIGTQLQAVAGRTLSFETVLGGVSWRWHTVAEPVLKVDLDSDFIRTLKAHGLAQPIFSGRAAFELYDTYGFPLDLTELMVHERGLTVDKEGFEKLMEEQRARARAAQKKTVISISKISDVRTQFVGYDQLEAACNVDFSQGPEGLLAVVDVSPMYAEMGGQVGDTGELTIEGDKARLHVLNTVKRGQAYILLLESTEEEPWSPLAENLRAHLKVDAVRRAAIQRHHTVTHLLHWALHEVVSKEVSQKGSFVGPDKLTFDFNSAPLTPQQVADIEKLVNERILENAPVSWIEVPYADIKRRDDIRQFFGEKYGDTVRVLQIGGERGKLNGYSMELCGGTHVRATGEIGLFRIVSEAAIAAGVRRIEAVAGLEAYRKASDELELIKSIAGKVNSPVGELEKKIENILEQQKALEKQLKALAQQQAAQAAKGLIARAQTINGVPAIIENMGAADGDTLQGMVNELKGQFKGVIILGGVAPQGGGAVALVASVSPEFTKQIQAGKIIQQVAPIVGGKGGGKPDNARGGGKDTGKLDEALAKAKSLLG